MNEPQAQLDISRVHMIGIGGAGMSGVARILMARGSEVSGSDAKDSRVVLALRSMGAHIDIGHSAANIDRDGNPPTVVVTSFAAIPQDNPELLQAHELGIPVIRRSQLLAFLMRDYVEVLFAGTHGKTSSTSMAVVAMQKAGMDPSFAVGGQLNRAGTNAHHGTGLCFVAEADESDASLVEYQPHIAVVTNIEPDHLDFFHTAEAYVAIFDDFVDRIVDGGTLVVCLNDDNAAALGERSLDKNVNVLGYGTIDAAEKHPRIPVGALIKDYNTTKSGTSATLAVGETTVNIVVHTPGEHMVLNAAGALVAGYLAGGNIQELAEGISDFSGVRRRFEYHGSVGHGRALGASVYDDYAHHPTEVAAVLKAARAKVDACGRGRVMVVFQPHMYSRTVAFAQEFAEALSLADEVVVLDVFGAREKPVEGVDGRIIAEKIDGSATYIDSFAAVPEFVAEHAEPHDLVLTMGAGSVTLLADEILDALDNAGE